jgi:hypothetical protein
MRRLLKSSFLCQFGIGFVIGAIGLVTMQPAGATRTLEHNIATATHLARQDRP